MNGGNSLFWEVFYETNFENESTVPIISLNQWIKPSFPT